MSITAEMTDVYIEKNQLHPSKIVELGSLPAIKKAVLNGIGVGIISSPVIRQALDQNILVSLVSRAEPVHVFSSLIILKSKTEWPNARVHRASSGYLGFGDDILNGISGTIVFKL